MTNQDKGKIEWLIVIIGIVTICLLAAVFLGINDKINNPQGFLSNLSILILQILPNLLTSIIIFLVLYYLFQKRGITLNDEVSGEFNSKLEDLESLLRDLINNNIFHKNKIEEILITLKGIKEKSSPWVLGGYENYSKVPWETFINNSENLTMAVFYCDKWIDSQKGNLINMLKKKDAELIIYLPDYRNKPLLTKINEVIPLRSPESISKRIQRSISKIQKIMNDSHIDSHKVNIRLYKFSFSHTVQIFNNKLTFVSINEMRREGSYSSPYVLIDLTESNELNTFYKSELEILERNSSAIEIMKWKPNMKLD